MTFDVMPLGFIVSDLFVRSAQRDDAALPPELTVACQYSSLRRGSLSGEPRPGRDEDLETAADPGAADTAVADHGAGVRRVDHVAVADVDAHMY